VKDTVEVKDTIEVEDTRMNKDGIFNGLYMLRVLRLFYRGAGYVL
jgi:hypothetical protein